MNERPLHNMLTGYRDFVQEGVMLGEEDTKAFRLLLAATGLGGEGGEVIDLIKKRIFHRCDIPREEFILELGDVFWYFTLACDELGITLDEIVLANMRKLVNRYPEKHPTMHHLLDSKDA